MLKNFIFRWGVSSLGLWIAAGLLGSDRMVLDDRLVTILGAGLVFALVNIFVKPFLIFLSLPALLLSLGLFMVVINGLIVMLASHLYDPLHVSSLWVAMVAGLIIGFVNMLVSKVVKEV
jgi:putative membrane protein